MRFSPQDLGKYCGTVELTTQSVGLSGFSTSANLFFFSMTSLYLSNQQFDLIILFHFQITDKDLIELIRVKSRLAQPYAGAFLKKEDGYVLLFYTICYYIF